MPLVLLLILATLKGAIGFVLGLVSGEVLRLNGAGVPGFLPWAVSAWLVYVAVRCWRDGGKDARLIGLLWALVASWLADRSIRVLWVGAGEVPVEGLLLAVYVPFLWRIGLLGRMARSTAREMRRVPRWIWVGVACLPVALWSTPGAWLAVTATVVYGPAVVGSGVTLRTLRR